MSEQSQPAAPSAADTEPRTRPERHVPGIPVWITVAVFAGIGVWAWTQSDTWAERVPAAGPALSRIVILLMSVLTVFTLLGWLVFRSTHAVAVKIVATLGVLAIPFAFRIEHSGDLFSSRIYLRGYAPDQSLELPETLAGKPATINTDPAVADNNAFPQYMGPNRNGVLTRLRLADKWEPDVLWRLDDKVGAGWSGFTAVGGIAYTQEQRGDDELVVAYEIATGDVIWFHADHGERHDHELGGVGPCATPTVHQDRLYTMGGTGLLNCIDAYTGKPIWQRNVVEDCGSDKATDAALVPWGRAGSPLVVDSMVIVPGGGKDGTFTTLKGYDLADGKPVWQAGTEQISYSSPMLYQFDGVRQIVIVQEASIAGYAVEDGKLLWSHAREGSTAGDANTSQPQQVGDDRLLVTKGYGGGAELLRLIHKADDSWSVASLWTNPRALNTKLTSAVVLGDYAYGLNNGILECVALADGKSMWRKGRHGHGQILAVGDDLLVMSESGSLFRVKATPEAYEATDGVALLDGICWNTLCLYGDTLLARNNRSAVSVRLSLGSNRQGGRGGRGGLSAISSSDELPTLEHVDVAPWARDRDETSSDNETEEDADGAGTSTESETEAEPTESTAPPTEEPTAEPTAPGNGDDGI